MVCGPHNPGPAGIPGKRGGTSEIYGKEGEWIEAEAPLLDGEHTFTAMECAEQNGAANVFSSDGRGLLRANAGSDIVVGHINTTGVKDITVNANSPFEINESTSISLITDNKDVWATVPFRESNTSSYQSYHSIDYRSSTVCISSPYVSTTSVPIYGMW